VVTVNLSVFPTYSITEEVAICEGETYILPDGTSVTTTGTFTSTLTTLDGCDSIITTNLVVGDTYLIALNPSICEGEVYTLPDGSDTSDEGLYTFTYSTISGCDSIIEVDLTVSAEFVSSEDVEFCDGGSYTLPDGTIVTAAGTYTSTLTSAGGCDSIITSIVSVLPSFAVSETVEICDGSSYVLPDGTTVSAAGIYTSSLNTVDGCDSIITSTVSLLPIPEITFDFPNQFCLESEPYLLSALPTGGTFSGDAVDGDYFLASLNGVGSTSITYTVEDINGCTNSMMLSTMVTENVIDAGPDLTIEYGDSITIFVDGIGTVEWTPSAGLSCNDCYQPVASPTQTTTYQVTEYDENGCVAIDFISVNVEYSEDYGFFVPNTFTPNGDFSNDYFFIYGYNIETVISFRVYDRWGQLMFIAENQPFADHSDGWNGNFMGKPVNTGVYAWVAECITISGKKITRAGNVMLIR
jgi:gliding motility-associated-like protein